MSNPEQQIPTDVDAQRLIEAKREEARRAGKFELPSQGEYWTSSAIAPTREAAALAAAETWEPECVTTGCGQPLGYRAKVGSYGALTLCAACRAGSVSARLRASGISEIEIDAPLEALEIHCQGFERYMQFLRCFAALKPGQRIEYPFAFVYGSNGVGKSAGAQRALRDAIKNGCQGRFIRLQSLLDSIYDKYGSEHSGSMRIFYSAVHLLVVDSVGHEHATAHSMARFFELVDDRHRNRLPTIFEANYAPTQQSLGAVQNDNEARTRSILDRIRGGSGDQVFEILGKSRRGKR